MVERVRVGIIGVGRIAPAYMTGMGKFPILDVTGCADLDSERAQAFAAAYGITAYKSVAALLADSTIDIILNLTNPQAHAAVSLQILNAGKHLYTEKPLAVAREQGRDILEMAQAKGLTVSAAPDTFLGGGGQTARKLLDAGTIGRSVAATAIMGSSGPGPANPTPWVLYQPGGGPLFDMGPYYLTALVNLLGPVKQVTAITGTGIRERFARHESILGQPITVEIPTHYAGTLAFHPGVIVTLIMSFDIVSHPLRTLEIYGTAGTLSVPDPNTFTGPVQISREREWSDVPLAFTDDLQRGVGVADTAYALRSGRPHRASGALAYHILDIMQALNESAERGQHVTLTSTVERPAPLPEGLAPGTLD